MVKRSTDPNIYFVELLLAKPQESELCAAAKSKDDFESLRNALGASKFEPLSSSLPERQSWKSTGPAVELGLMEHQGTPQLLLVNVESQNDKQLATAIAEIARLAAPAAPETAERWIRGSLQSNFRNSRMFAGGILTATVTPPRNDQRVPQVCQLSLSYPELPLDDDWSPLVEDDDLED